MNNCVHARTLTLKSAPLRPDDRAQLSGKPENVAKKAAKDKIIEIYNMVFERGLVASDEDREAVRLAKELEAKAKLETERAAQQAAQAAQESVARLPIEVEAGVFEDPSSKKYMLNLTKKQKGARKAYKGQVVRLNYTMRGEDGTIYDSTTDADFVRNKNAAQSNLTKSGKVSERGAALQFKIGANQVIRGWDECVKEMAQGECASVTIEPEWAYGSKGSLNQTTGGKLNPVWPYLHSGVCALLCLCLSLSLSLSFSPYLSLYLVLTLSLSVPCTLRTPRIHMHGR